jgi:hypothetical protein
MKITKVRMVVMVFIISLAMILPILVFASSYHSTLSFDSYLEGTSRSYSGNNITIEMTCSADQAPDSVYSKYFTTKLYRDHFLIDDYVGSYSSCKRNGSTSVTWSNVGAADYYFVFSKAVDGIWVNSDDVYMHN